MHVGIQAKESKSSDYTKDIESGDMKGTGNARFPLAFCFVNTRKSFFD